MSSSDISPFALAKSKDFTNHKVFRNVVVMFYVKPYIAVNII